MHPHEAPKERSIDPSAGTRHVGRTPVLARVVFAVRTNVREHGPRPHDVSDTVLSRRVQGHHGASGAPQAGIAAPDGVTPGGGKLGQVVLDIG